MIKDLKCLLHYDNIYKQHLKKLENESIVENQVEEKEDKQQTTNNFGDYLSNYNRNINGEYTFLDLSIKYNINLVFDTLSHFKNIQNLTITNNRLSSTVDLKPFLNLTECDLSNNKITALPINLPDTLLFLNLSNNRISNVIDLSEMNNVKDLKLNQNKIISMETQGENTHIEFFDISDNEINGIDLIGSCPNLIHLNINNCNLLDLNGLSFLPSLQILNASGNRIKSLQPLVQSLQLKHVNLRDNYISSLNQLKGLSQLNLIETVDLKGNPVTEIKFYKHIILSNLPIIFKLDGEDLTAEDFVETDVFFGKDLEDRKQIVKQVLGECHFEDNRIEHSDTLEFMDIISEPPEMLNIDLY